MYYRVKKFNGRYQNMFVFDQDINLTELKRRDSIDCAGLGYREFNNSQLIESQNIKCINNGQVRNSDIIKE
jgi:hypothetical protein